ncbi:ornithine-acyl ACP N-acyltransferase [Alphaproteobacteria bacterium]|nr:ornithine-acyl ACP N-acyltransferase [Alphaproteobacteria bacterium]
MMSEDGGEDEGVSGRLDVCLASSPDEIEAAQRLRYRVFYEEMGAKPTPEMATQKRDFDAFDEVFDHLLVIDRQASGDVSSVVGTYRIQRRESEKFRGFYTSDEYDVSAIDRFPGRVMELGRSCVDPNFRTMATMQALWRGLAGYVFHHNIDLMFGCASLHGTDPDSLAAPLSYLHQNHLAPENLRPRALPGRFVEMNRISAAEINLRRSLAMLPPLMKGYLRLGGFVGDGAVIDEQFNTVDICVIVKTDMVTDKYFRHYDRTAARDL